MRIVPIGLIGPHNSPSKSCFLTPREKKRMLISSSYSPYGFASLGRITTIRFYPPRTRPWRFNDQGMRSFNFGNSLVSHVQWLDENPTVDRLSYSHPTVDRLSWNMSGRTPAHNFCITINNLSNQLLFTLNDCVILKPVYWTCYFFSLSHSSTHLQIPKPCPRTISHTCKSSWTIFNFYTFFAKFPF